MIVITYGRYTDEAPPERELLSVDASGAATGWRSIAPAGGRFGGRVPDIDRLLALAEAAAASPVPDAVELPPESITEELRTGGHEVTLPRHFPPASPWADLATACREALDALSSSPVAAVAASVDRAGKLHLEHRGTEPLPVELRSMTAKATLWRDSAEVWSASYPIPDGLVRTDVGPGWALDLDPSDAVPDGPGVLLAEVDLVADDNGVLVPLTLTAHVRR